MPSECRGRGQYCDGKMWCVQAEASNDGDSGRVNSTHLKPDKTVLPDCLAGLFWQEIRLSRGGAELSSSLVGRDDAGVGDLSRRKERERSDLAAPSRSRFPYSVRVDFTASTSSGTDRA